MSSLPFIEDNKLPKLRKLSGVSKYGFSEDDELVESSLNELMQAIESKNHTQLVTALKALIDCIVAKEQGEDKSNAVNEKA